MGEGEIEGLDELAEEMRLSRSELARSALSEGVRRLRAERALARYLNLEFTLSRAARYAGVTIREMADLAASLGIPSFRYSLDELRRDRERGGTWAEGGPMRVWIDASTLIALDAVGESLALREVLGRVTVTPRVAAEVFSGREAALLREALGSWINVLRVRGSLSRWADLGLGEGEASLFQTPRQDRLVLDEIPARTVAEAEGPEYIGLQGLLLGDVDAEIRFRARFKEILRKLARSSFRMSTDLYAEVVGRLEGRD